MNYEEKLYRMDKHLKEHPHDYQTVVSRLKVASQAYEHRMKRSRNERLKTIAEIRKRLKEEDECRRIH